MYRGWPVCSGCGSQLPMFGSVRGDLLLLRDAIWTSVDLHSVLANETRQCVTLNAGQPQSRQGDLHGAGPIDLCAVAKGSWEVVSPTANATRHDGTSKRDPARNGRRIESAHRNGGQAVEIRPVAKGSRIVVAPTLNGPCAYPGAGCRKKSSNLNDISQTANEDR